MRCGYVTEEMICAFKERVFDMPITEKFDELQQLGQSPVCIFPTRKACIDFNNSMLASLDSEVHQIKCIDEVDETASKFTWTKKADGQLQKLNNDSNMTAGLEAILMMAVGARVTLRRKIDSKVALVNGALGTVVSITGLYIKIKFDDINEPYGVERVKGKFILMKKYFIYRKQFPIMLAFAITIHKCQGLSLTSAIIDMSNSLFALSRVKTMDSLHLIKFENHEQLMIITIMLQNSNRRRKSKVWFPVNEQWQRNVCQQFGLKFVFYNGATPGGPDVPLGHCVKTRKTYGDGNWMFQSFAKLITGSPGEQLKVHKLIDNRPYYG